MKKLLGILCAVTLIFGVAGVANATLVGDTVDLEWLYPDTSSVFKSTSGTVVLNWDYGTTVDTISVNAGSIVFDFSPPPASDPYTFLSDGSFNGLLASDLDDDTTNDLSDVTVSGDVTPTVTWGNDSDGGWVLADFAGLAVSNGDQVTIDLEFAGTSIPDPAAVFLLGSAALVGFAGLRRRFKKS